MRTKEDVIKIYGNELNSFESEKSKIREFTLTIMTYMPDYFFEDEKIIIHTKSCMVMANELFKLECFRDKFQMSERDSIRCALILHDAMLNGNGSERVYDHPEYVSTYIMTDYWESLLPKFMRKEIADMISSHEGQWNRSETDEYKLKKPESDAEIFVHMCVHVVSVPECTVSLPCVVNAYESFYGNR